MGLLSLIGINAKPVVEQITLNDQDLVKFDGQFDILYVVRDGRCYTIKEDLLKLDILKPVNVRYVGAIGKSESKRYFQTFKKLRDNYAELKRLGFLDNQDEINFY